MTIRYAIAAAALAAALAAPALAAQDHKLPESMAYLRLPDDPTEAVRVLLEGHAGGPTRLFEAGCPSDGGWAGAAFAALEGMAETDPRTRRAMVGLWEGELWRAFEKEHGYPNDFGLRCPADFPPERAGPWLAAELRRAWETGVFADERPTYHPLEPVRSILLEAMEWTTAPEAYAVLRDIARDPGVYSDLPHSDILHDFPTDFRSDAARSMLGWRLNGGMGDGEAVKAVEADLAGAPPILDNWRYPPRYEYPEREVWLGRRRPREGR